MYHFNQKYSFHNLYHAVLKKSTKKNDNVYNLDLEKKKIRNIIIRIKKIS